MPGHMILRGDQLDFEQSCLQMKHLRLLMGATLPNSFSRKVFLASGDKPSTDFGSDFKCFSLYRGVVHFDAELRRRTVVFLQAWYHFVPSLFL